MKEFCGMEQRVDPRYPVERGSFAIFSGVDRVMPGIIVDISRTGLAFLYFDGEDWPYEMSSKYHLFGDDFHVNGVCVETIFDVKVVACEEHPLYELALRKSSSPLTVKRRGARFKDLNRKQQADLDVFIKRFQETGEIISTNEYTLKDH